MISSINIIGLRNFRIFDDGDGIFEEIAPINILTGSNNSGKSSIIKFLQMLKDSMKGNKYPFDLDLTKQEHLLGDFDNVLFNRNNREVVVCLPFIFLGIKDFYISLKFKIPSGENVYQANLREIEVVDKKHNVEILSFKYREATETEKKADSIKFKKEIEIYKNRNKEQSKEQADIFSFNSFIHIPPMDNPLVGYIEWSIKLNELKKHLKNLLEFYKMYLENKNSKKWLEYADKYFENKGFIPSELIKSFKNEVDIKEWDDFLNNIVNENSLLSGEEPIGERDFDADDYFYPPYEIKHLVYYNVLKILREKLYWKSTERDGYKYSVIENCFKISWETLIQRINSIHYLSTIREINSRVYTATNNTPFVELLKDYKSNEFQHSRFINKYLEVFEIGKKLSVNYTLKYQLISVSVVTFEGIERDLVDFGYGIKQLILILIQISVLAERNKKTTEDYDDNGMYLRDYYKPSMLLIEEPETNLHPKWQSLLAKMFAEAHSTFNIQFIIETHSEYLIRKFQTLVADDTISPEKIKIFYIRHPKNTIQDKKQVSSVNIQQDGRIDYQIFDGGFFDENDSLELSLLNIQRGKFLDEFYELKKDKEERENKITELEQKIDDYTNKLDIQMYQTIVNNRFDISKISPVTVKYLSSGQFLLNTIDETSDFSPVIIQYGRTIENELKEIFVAIGVNDNQLMLGKFQGALEKFKTETSIQSTYNDSILNSLPSALSDRFNNPQELKIELLNEIRKERNSSAHSGQIKTKQDAIRYIELVNTFLEKWISEKK